MECRQLTAVSFCLAAVLVLGASAAAAADLAVTGLSPTRNSIVAANTTVSITFDKALMPSSVNGANIRVFGRGTGTKTGTLALSNGDQTVTLTPTTPFSAGEIVLVNLSHNLTATDSTTLRSAGYAYQFVIATQPASMIFAKIAEMTNRTAGAQTRIYGAMATDLNHDGYIDLNTVNEVSSDLRVFLNRADGTGLYNPFLTPPFPIGLESSPNEQADLDNDGDTDAVVSSTAEESAWVAIGHGNGTFGPSQEVSVGGQPHGIAVLDVDGDADLDVAIANFGSDDLGLMINNGSGTLSAATFFESGCDGEYALASGDMNNDGITDLIVGCWTGEEVVVDLGNGDGTLTPSTPRDAGGHAWQLVVGDVDGDGTLDATTANSQSSSGSILIGNGDGTLQAAAVQSMPGHTVATDLGDLDGDGDLDWVLSSFGGTEWHVFTNDGAGTFTFSQMISATSNPSCAVLFDLDNDGDLDMALTDEIADTVTLMQNGGVAPAATCAPAPQVCRSPVQSGGAKLLIKDPSGGDNDQIKWKWGKGAATAKADFGNPLALDAYVLCIYDNGNLVSTAHANAGGLCGTHACWKEGSKNFSYKNSTLSPDGTQKLLLKEGLVAGTAKILFKGRGVDLEVPNLSLLTGPIHVQLQKSTGAPCWGAVYSAPFLKHHADGLRAKSN